MNLRSAYDTWHQRIFDGAPEPFAYTYFVAAAKPERASVTNVPRL